MIKLLNKRIPSDFALAFLLCLVDCDSFRTMDLGENIALS